MVNKLVMYQKGQNFVLTRAQEKKEIDAEELLHNLEAAREQLKDHMISIEEFRRDIKEMERLEPLAKRMRDGEIKESKKQRSDLK